MKEIFKNRKPTICPTCGYKPVAKIIYGLPKDPESSPYERKLYELEEEGKVVFGGCILLTILQNGNVQSVINKYGKDKN